MLINQFVKPAVLAFSFAIALTSCNKDEVTPPVPSKDITYELKGDFTGKVTIAYTNESGAVDTLKQVDLPWSKQVLVPNSANRVVFSAVSTEGEVGEANQTLNALIYMSDAIVRDKEFVADEAGKVQTENLGFEFTTPL